MKVMLLYPPGSLYQRGEDRCQGNIEDSSATAMRACNDLGYAAAVLLKRGYQVFLKDYQTERLSERDVIRDLSSFQPDAVVISTTNATVFTDIQFTERMKQIRPFIAVLKGAIFYDCEKELLELLDLSKIEYLIGGEIDFIIGDLMDHALRGEGDVKKIRGIYYKNSFGEMQKTLFHVWEEDLDGQPFPARHLMNNKLYVRPDTGEAMATIQTARGCPAQCIYCLTPEISGRKVRFRSPQNVFEEIRECYEIHHIRNFFFKADTFTINAAWVKELCQLIIQSPLNKKIAFTANSRVKPLDKETLSLMKQAGCFMVAFGFESGSQRTLELIRKGCSVEDNRRAVRWCKEVGLPVYGFYMIGFPWETKKDLLATVSHIFELDCDFIEIHVALPYYGTELYRICREKRVLKKGTFGSDYFHSSTTGTQKIPMEELVRLRKQVMLRYYLRPNYLIRKIKYGVSHPIILKNYMKYGWRMVKNLVLPISVE